MKRRKKMSRDFSFIIFFTQDDRPVQNLQPMSYGTFFFIKINSK